MSLEKAPSGVLGSSRRKFLELSDTSEVVAKRRHALALDRSTAAAEDDEEEDVDASAVEEEEEPVDRRDMEDVLVWYASYGSNTWKERFMCYLKGGEVEGMNKIQVGAKRHDAPRDEAWKQFHHRMFFARQSNTWKLPDKSPGGVAFLDPERDQGLQLQGESTGLKKEEQGAWLHMYLIALDQFNDVVAQESAKKPGKVWITVDQVEELQNEEHVNNSLQVFKSTFYPMVKYLGSRPSKGSDKEYPILTFTCSYSQFDKIYDDDIERYRLNNPSPEYLRAIKNGLEEILSDDEIDSYLEYCKNGKLKRLTA